MTDPVAVETVAETKVEVSLPQESQALADGLAKLVLSVVASHKAAGGAAVEVGADLAAAIQDLGPALAGAGLLGSEIAGDPVGMAEAFVLAGVAVAKGLLAAK